MSFGDILRAKVDAWRKRGSTVEAIARKLRDQAFDRHRDTYDAVIEMVGRLVQDPVFAAGFETMPNAEFKHEIDDLGEDIRIDVQGPVGSVLVIIVEQPATPRWPAQMRPRLRINPAHDLCGALRCSWTYAEATSVTATTADVSGFIVAAEDLLAEFLADVVVSPVAAKFLTGPTTRRRALRGRSCMHPSARSWSSCASRVCPWVLTRAYPRGREGG